MAQQIFKSIDLAVFVEMVQPYSLGYIASGLRNLSYIDKKYTTKIIEANTPEQFDAVRELCWEYRTFLLGLGQIDAKIVRTFYLQSAVISNIPELKLGNKGGGNEKTARSNRQNRKQVGAGG